MKPLTYALAACVVIAALAGAAYLLLVKAPADAVANAARVADQVLDGVTERLHFKPTVTINEKTAFYRSREIAELALVESPVIQDYKWRHEWLGSTKELALRGTYAVKKGFALDSRFTIDLDSRRRIVTVHLPPPMVLSAEQVGIEIHEDDGWWNKLVPEDREAALRELRLLARRQAALDVRSDTETVEAIKRRLAGFLTEDGWTVIYQTSPLPEFIAKP